MSGRYRVWKTVDRLNATLGRRTVRLLSAGPKNAVWKLRAEHLSPVDYAVGRSTTAKVLR